MKKLTLTVLSLALSWLAAGCLESPLLNHADADQIRIAKDSDKNVNAACQFALTDPGLCASLEWKTQPADETKGAFTLRFWDSNLGSEHGPYVTPSHTVAVKLWMPDMGHGSSPVTVKPSIDASGTAIPGVFEATDIYFVMGGHWEIWVQLKQDKQVISQAKIDYDL